MSLPRLLRSLLTILLLGPLASLIPALSAADAPTVAPSAKPLVVTTNTILDDFVRTLAGRLTADGVMRHPLPL